MIRFYIGFAIEKINVGLPYDIDTGKVMSAIDIFPSDLRLRITVEIDTDATIAAVHSQG